MSKTKKKTAPSELELIKKQVVNLSPEEKKDLSDFLLSELEPYTEDFEEEDWENVARMQCDGTDRLDAIRSQREFIDSENDFGYGP